MRTSQKLRKVFGVKTQKILALCLALLLFLQLPASFLNTADVFAVSQADIDEQQDKLDELNTKKNDLEAELEALEEQKASNLEKKELLDEQVSLTQEQIDTTNEQITQYEGLIADKELEIQDLEKQEAKQLELYKERVRAMEERGSISYYSILFGASSFSDLLSRLDFINEIMEYDEMIYNQLIEAREATQNAKAELEATKTELETKKSELETLKAELDTQISEVSSIITAIQSDITEYENLVNEAEEEANAVQEQINSLSEQLKAQNEAANNAASGGSSDGTTTPVYSGDGTYIWPTASKYITSPYGNRLHPILGYYRYHSGIDIGGGGGNPVMAAAAGTVIISQWSDSYGYYVVIDHGNSTTLYAHMSRLNVSVGQYVNQGDTVGNVGSTGLSTGNHLHFEISINGSRIDPLTQFDSSTYIRAW